eukprot:12075028-Alexandrium_andersonii.AAC.1
MRAPAEKLRLGVSSGLRELRLGELRLRGTPPSACCSTSLQCIALEFQDDFSDQYAARCPRVPGRNRR